MKKNSRLDQIRKMCQKSGTVSIKYLAESLNVSEITIRRDLELLENLNLVKRERKGAIAIEPQSLNNFLYYNIENEYQKKIDQKKKIGQKAVSLIQPGETIIFDSGSTLWHTVQSLPERIPITAICYGLKIAEVLSKKYITQLILIGGIYHKDMDMFEILSEYDALKNIRAQKAFISAFGIHNNAGLTSGSFFATSIRKKIISSSEKVFILADSSKFGKIEWAHFADLNEIDLIITDKGISEEYIEKFNQLGIQVLIV